DDRHSTNLSHRELSREVLTPAEAWRPLLEEGRDTFLEIGRIEGRELRLRLELEHLVERGRGAASQRPLDRGGDTRRPGRDLTGEGARGGLQLRGRHHAVEDAESLGPFGADHSAGVDQLGGEGGADEPGEEEAPAPVGVQADAGEGEADRRGLARDAEVACEGEACAGAGGGP